MILEQLILLQELQSGCYFGFAPLDVPTKAKFYHLMTAKAQLPS